MQSKSGFKVNGAKLYIDGKLVGETEPAHISLVHGAEREEEKEVEKSTVDQGISQEEMRKIFSLSDCPRSGSLSLKHFSISRQFVPKDMSPKMRSWCKKLTLDGQVYM